MEAIKSRTQRGRAAIKVLKELNGLNELNEGAGFCGRTRKLRSLSKLLWIVVRNSFHVSHFTHHASRMTLFCLLLTLAAVPISLSQTTEDKQATFFMGRVKYSSSNEGND